MKPVLSSALALLLATLQSASPVPVRIPVRVSLELAGPAASAPVAGVLKLSPRSGSGKVIEIPMEVPGARQVDLASASETFDATFVAKGFWGETVTISAGSPASDLRLRVFPAGKIAGRIAVPAGEKPLAALTVRVQPPFFGRKVEPLDAAIHCPLDPEGRLACELPAGRFDLRLRTEAGYAPVYFWEVQIPTDKTADLGEIRLRRGASVSGWVQTAEGQPPSPECRLTLSPASAPADEFRILDQLEKGSFEARPNEKGFFQIAGVPPGQYELSASQPGYAPTRIRPIQVRPNLEAQVIDRLVLARPVTFEIALNPPLEPLGKQWKITLARKNHPSDPPADVRTGTASPEGVWKVPGIPPGSYELQVFGDLKSVWHEEYIEIQPGQPTLRIDLPVLFVKGTVTIGEEPLAATVWLAQKDGARLRFDSDDRGHFAGVLTGPGLWAPKITSEAEKLQVQLEPIEIKPPKGKDVAQVEIQVPDTTLRGQVVNEAGQPVVAALVHVSNLEKRWMNQIATDEKGEFSFRGLRPGAAIVNASFEDEETDPAATSVPQEGEAPWLRLVIRKLRAWEGRIVSPQGGVSGAMVIAWSALINLGEASQASSDQVVSGADGRFQVKLPPGTPAISVLVLPPGHALRLLSVPASPGQPLEIPVEPQGGTLVLELPKGEPPPVLVHGNTFAVPSLLTAWARMQGLRSDPGRLVLPNVEAGAYSLCRGVSAISKLRQGSEAPAASCTSGVLSPNGELVLKAPGETAPASAP